MRLRFLTRICLVAACLVGAADSGLRSVGELSVYPTLVSFHGRTRHQELTVQNTGKTKVRYRIGFVYLKMSEYGDLAELAQPDSFENSAVPYLRVSPRQVELEPGEFQKIRIQLRKPSDLRDGEYRTHLQFLMVPHGDKENLINEQPGEGVQVRLRAIPGVAVPVSFLQGDIKPDVNLVDIGYQDGVVRVFLIQRGKATFRGRAVLVSGKRRKEVAACEVVHYFDLDRQIVEMGTVDSNWAKPLRVQLRDDKDKIVKEIVLSDGF